MYNIEKLQDRYPNNYVINLDILGNGYDNTIFVSYIPPDLDKAITENNSKRICKLAQDYFDSNSLSKDVYHKLLFLYEGG